VPTPATATHTRTRNRLVAALIAADTLLSLGRQHPAHDVPR